MNRSILRALSAAAVPATLWLSLAAGPSFAEDAAATAKQASPAAEVAAPVAAAAKAAGVAKPATTKPKAETAKPKATDAASAEEKLPWADGAAKPAVTAAKPAKDKTTGEATAKTEGPLKMACPGLYEAACREAQGCTWIADIKLESGSDVKAHCSDRTPAAAKNTPAKKPVEKTAAAKSVVPKPAAPAAKAEAAPAAPAAKPATPAATVAVTPPAPAAAAPVSPTP